MTEYGLGGNVSVADGSECDDGPIDAAGDGSEAGFGAFDHVHDCTEYEAENSDGEEENGDLAAAGSERGHEILGFADVSRELENSENAQEAEGTEGEEGLRASEEEGKVFGEGGNEVDDAIKGEDVGKRAPDGDDTGYVFGCKECGDGPLECVEELAVAGVDAFDAFEHYKYYGEYDNDEENDIEELAGWCIGFVDDFMEFLAPGRHAGDLLEE